MLWIVNCMPLLEKEEFQAKFYLKLADVKVAV